jgi:hypothetical protein
MGGAGWVLASHEDTKNNGKNSQNANNGGTFLYFHSKNSFFGDLHQYISIEHILSSIERCINYYRHYFILYGRCK